jgi:hypothetical protein
MPTFNQHDQNPLKWVLPKNGPKIGISGQFDLVPN